MKHILMMVVGCGLALLLIFLLPAMGLGSGWMLATTFILGWFAGVLTGGIYNLGLCMGK